MKVVLVAGGSPQAGDERWLEGAGLVVAVDVGAAWLAGRGIRPDAVVGDLDSVDPGLIAALEAHILQDTRPDLTLVFDLPAQVGLERAHARAGAEMRFESKGVAFHERLREGFRAIAVAEPARCVLIDATGSMDTVERLVWAAVAERLRVHG